MLNRPERIAYHRLCESCAPRSAQVYAKVRLADVLPVEGSGLSHELYEFALQAHYDFVITDLAQTPLFAVEYDGPGHSDPAQVERDSKKNELSRRFNLPLLRIVAHDLHRTELRLDRMTEVTERWLERSESESDERRAAGNGPAAPLLARGRNVAESPSCPLCGSGMVLKDGKYGPFLSCVRYPDCQGSCDLPGPSTTLRSQAITLHGPAPNSFPRQWLIAGMVIVGLALGSLMVIFAHSITERTRAREPARIAAGPDSATIRQMNLLGLIVGRRRWDTAKRDAEIERVLGYTCSYSELNKREASKLITAWDDRGK